MQLVLFTNVRETGRWPTASGCDKLHVFVGAWNPNNLPDLGTISLLGPQWTIIERVLYIYLQFTTVQARVVGTQQVYRCLCEQVRNLDPKYAVTKDYRNLQELTGNQDYKCLWKSSVHKG
jgi:hypothetical protein